MDITRATGEEMAFHAACNCGLLTAESRAVRSVFLSPKLVPSRRHSSAFCIPAVRSQLVTLRQSSAQPRDGDFPTSGSLNAAVSSLFPGSRPSPGPLFARSPASCSTSDCLWQAESFTTKSLSCLRRKFRCQSQSGDSGPLGKEEQSPESNDGTEGRESEALDSDPEPHTFTAGSEPSTAASEAKVDEEDSIASACVQGNVPASLGEQDDAGTSTVVADWRAFRARLVASEKHEVRARPGDGGLGVSEKLGESAGDVSNVALGTLWAHALYAPEKGCLLVASELLHGYNFFQRSVILLLGVGTGPSDGPYGIALNKPFPRTVAKVDSILPGLATTFGSCQVHVGGPIGPRTVLLVHGHEGLDGHCEVLPGVFVAGLAGLPAAAQLVEEGKAKVEDFQVVLGYAGWGEEQLRQEIAQGWWYVAACSHDVILEARKRCAPGREGDPGKGDRLWQDVLRLMGGEFAEVGNRTSSEDS